MYFIGLLLAFMLGGTCAIVAMALLQSGKRTKIRDDKFRDKD